VIPARWHPGRLARAAALAIAAGVAGCGASGGGSSAPPPPPPGPTVQAWVTTGDRTQLLARDVDRAFGDQALQSLVIDVDPSVAFQSVAGVGAAITDASAWVLRHRMNASQREALLQELYGRDAGGLGLNFGRLTIGASDFSLSHYTYDDLPAGQTDAALAHFSIDPARADLLPVVQRALAINPSLHLMASPWSPPAWMKTSGSLYQGTLRPEMYGAHAEYLVRTVEAFAAEGVPIFALTLQNEPHYAPVDYPGMLLDETARATLIGQYLGPKLALRAPATAILEWDHNWDEPGAPLAVLADPVARPYVSGVAWHCYGGEVGAQDLVQAAWPDKDTWFTECTASGFPPADWAGDLAWSALHIVIGTMRHGARGALEWNLALDETGGPHLGGCGTCRGIVTVDSASGAVTRNPEYYALAHASRFVRDGARRIGSTQPGADLGTLALRNPDGSLVLIVCNGGAVTHPFSVRQGGRSFRHDLAPLSVATFTWTP